MEDVDHIDIVEEEEETKVIFSVLLFSYFLPISGLALQARKCQQYPGIFTSAKIFC